MKKKWLLTLVILVLACSIFALTACDFAVSDFKDLFSNKQLEQSPSELPNENTGTEKPESSSTKSTLSVLGKTFVFDTVALDVMIYPDIEEEISVDEEEEIEKKPLPSVEEMQMYVNEIYECYKDATLSFTSGNKATLEFADGSNQVCDYLQQLTTIYIGDIINNQMVPNIAGQVSMTAVILQMEFSDTCIAYLQFVVE